MIARAPFGSNDRMSRSRYPIHIEVETLYVAEQSAPEQDRYVFAYTITIRNDAAVAATLLTRYWRIVDANDRVQEVRGEGVVGEQPHLGPGEAFRYTSAAVLATPVGTMEGCYGMLADDGIEFDAPIPAFCLSVPSALH